MTDAASMRPTPRRLPCLLEVYLSRKGARWVVFDISGDGEPRSQMTVSLRLEGSTDALGRKVLTMPFFLASYTLADDQQGFLAAPAPAPEMTPRARRAANMHRLRRERGYTRSHMSKRTGIGPTFITEMERGKRSISIITIDRLGAGLGLASSAVLAELDR